MSAPVPKPLAGPPGMAALSAFAAPPPRVMAPPVESQEFEDHPEQIVFEASSLMTPPFDASVSDQRVIGPPFERRFTLAADKILRFDLSTKLLFDPVTVMFAPAVKSLDAPVEVRLTLPPAIKLASVVMLTHVIVRSSATLISPPKLPKAPDSPQFIVRELPEVALLTAADTVMAPALSI